MRSLVVFGPKAEILQSLYVDDFFKNWKLILVGRELNKFKTNIRSQKKFSEIITIEIDYLNLNTIKNYQKIIKDIAHHLCSEVDKNFFLFAQGTITRSLFFLQTDEQIYNQIKINFEFPIRCTNSLLKSNPNLLSANWYYLSSIATQRSDIGVSLYSSTKVALEKFCETLRLEQKLIPNPGTIKIIRLILIDGGLSKGLPNEVKNELQKCISNTMINSKSSLAKYLIMDFHDPDHNSFIIE